MATSSSTSSRWCPTQEQVIILEEIYNKGGIKTPNAFQIQQITAHLWFFGKIEGKNVFYWFQNHKARERQNLRRKLKQNQKQLQLSLHEHQPCGYHFSVPTAAFTLFHQGRRTGAPHQDSSTTPQSTIWPDISSVDGQGRRSFQHGCLLADNLSPHCSIGQAPPLKTLELFLLKSTQVINNNNLNPASARSQAHHHHLCHTN